MLRTRPTPRALVTVLSIAIASVGAVAHAAADCALVLEGARAPQAPPVATAWAGYGTLRNTGATPLMIRALRSPQFGAVELHESIHDGDVMRMRRIDPLELASGASITLEPHGKHLMLMRPQRALAVGERIELVIEACATPSTFALPVEGAKADDGGAHHHHH